MEFMYVKEIPKGEKKLEPATAKQLSFLEKIASNIGVKVNRDNMTKEKASRLIDQLRILDGGRNNMSLIRESEQKKRETEIKLCMAKKLVFHKWISESRKIDRQTENAFIQEVIYINDVLNKINSYHLKAAT